MRQHRAFAALVALAGLLVLAIVTPGAEPLTPEQAQQVEKIIRDYLLRNPEVLVEMSNTLRARQERAKIERAQKAIATSRAQLVNDPDSFVAGNPAGDVTIVAFFDYQCGYCRRVHPTLTTLLQRDTGVRLVLKELPVLGPGSEAAARAAIAALGQAGKYYAFHSALMENTTALDDTTVFAIAGQVGLDVAALRTAMSAPRVAEVIAANRRLATQIGVDGTPAFVIGTTLVPGAVPLERFQELVANQRKK